METTYRFRQFMFVDTLQIVKGQRLYIHMHSHNTDVPYCTFSCSGVLTMPLNDVCRIVIQGIFTGRLRKILKSLIKKSHESLRYETTP